MKEDAAPSTQDGHVGDTAVETPDSTDDRAAGVHSIAISSLLPADSPRLAGEDREHILRLMKVETGLPPILVHRSAMRVIDGMHRLRAAMLRGDKHIDVVFFDGSETEAFMRAVEINVAHGLPLSRADRRAAAVRIIATEPHLSDRVVAARTGLSARTVGSIRSSTAQLPHSNRRVGADGRSRPLSGTEGRSLALKVIAARPDASLREIARIAGISLSTAHDVRRRLMMGQDPVSRRHTAPVHRPADDGARPTPHPGPIQARARDRRSTNSDRTVILHRLMKDPSLRHTDPGRRLLRMLNAGAITAEDWTELLDSVPAHCTEAVADLARQCARDWRQFAQALEGLDGPRPSRPAI